MFDGNLGGVFGILRLLITPMKIFITLYIKMLVILKKINLYAAFHIFFFGCLFFKLPIFTIASNEGISTGQRIGLYILAFIVFAGIIVGCYFVHKLEIKDKLKKKTKTSTVINPSEKFEEAKSQKSVKSPSIPQKLLGKIVKKVDDVTTRMPSPDISTININPQFPPTPIESSELHGVFFGVKEEINIIKPENIDGHVLVVGGVGSGKSSCIAIPTLRCWEESAFVIDIKGELYEKTKDYRPNIKVFNPLDSGSYGYDPFFCLLDSSNPAQEARAIAQAIVPLPPETKEPFWIENAQNILSAAILHFSAQGLGFLDTIKGIQKSAPRSLIKELCASHADEACYYVNSMADMDDRTLSSIMSELSKNIVHFVTDKNLSSALSRENNITPADLEFGSDVYINIPEHLLRQWKNLLSLIVNQFLTHFEQRVEANARPILFLLDEFPRLGKVDTILDALATLRSKKISICLVVQSLAQLDKIYGESDRKIISDTCAYKAILGATDADTQEYFSRLAGTFDKLMTGITTAPLSFTNGSSVNKSEMEQRIIRSAEFGMLNDIVLFTPFPMPFEIPKATKTAEEEVIDSLFAWRKFSQNEKLDLFAPFCRVTKAPYYLES